MANGRSRVAAGIIIGAISGVVSASIVGGEKKAESSYGHGTLLAKHTQTSSSTSGDKPSGPFKSPKSHAVNPKVHGETIGNWGAKWWQWASSFPDGANPIQDETGELCAMKQSGKVWFLAGSFGVTGIERECHIPAGKAIFYPLFNTAWVDFPGDEMFTDDEVKIIVSNYADSACSAVSNLDVVSNLPNLGEAPGPVTARSRPIVRAQSDKMTVDLPEGNIFGLDPGVNERLISEGYWVMLPPLTPGEHVLTIYGARCGETEEEGFEKVFETEVTYYLTVGNGK